jgi:hypothetical protein
LQSLLFEIAQEAPSMHKNIIITIAVFVALQWQVQILHAQSTSADSIIWSCDFEAGQGLWQVSNDLWSIGEDGTLPSSVSRSGRMARGVLRGDIPASTFDTYLISPPVLLPLINANEELRVGFVHWHNYNKYTGCCVNVRIDSGGGKYGNWERESVYYESNLNLDYWKNASFIISKYAGKRINIGFRLYGHPDSIGNPLGRGWRIDDINIVKSRFKMNILPVAWDFDQDWSTESSANSWWDSYGLFCVSKDTLVPSPSQPNCAGTKLVPETDWLADYLASPSVQIPVLAGADDIILRFRYYLDSKKYLVGKSAIAEDSGNGNWGSWKVLTQYTTSTQWTRVSITLPASYQGKTVRFGFALACWTGSLGSPSGKGFYIDDVDLFSTSTNVAEPQLASPNNGSVAIGIKPTFRWRLTASAFNYRIQVSKDSLFAATLLDSSRIEPTSYAPTMSLPDTVSTYYWRVCATNGLGTSVWSNVWLFHSGLPKNVTAPHLEFPKNGSIAIGTRPTFRWQLVTSAFNYQIQVSKDSLFATTVLDSSAIDTASYTSTKNLPDTISTYYWHVCATNGYGTSVWSDVWHFHSGSTEVEKITTVQPKVFSLQQNYPNPFNPSTSISFSLPFKSFVSLKVFDVIGRQVATLVFKELPTGNHTEQWNAQGMPSGVYFYRLQAGAFTQTKKLVLLR